eukprot:COSAG02_NODE_12512_length_1534_cov_1.949129_2_plen_129_part_00
MVVTLRAASCAEVPKPFFRLDRYLRKRDWIEELEAKYDEAPTFGRRRRKSKGPRCALERDAPACASRPYFLRRQRALYETDRAIDRSDAPPYTQSSRKHKAEAGTYRSAGIPGDIPGDLTGVNTLSSS